MIMEFNEASAKRSMAGIVRAEIANIDLWLGRGVRLSAIYDQFIAQGMVGSFRSFNTSVWRARNRLKKGALTPSADFAKADEPANSQTTGLALAPTADIPQPALQAATKLPTAEAAGDEKLDLDQFFQRKSIFDR